MVPRPQGLGYEMGAYEMPLPGIDNDGGASDVQATFAALNGDLTLQDGLTTAVTVYWGTNDCGITNSAWDHSRLVSANAQQGLVSTIVTSLVQLTS